MYEILPKLYLSSFASIDTSDDDLFIVNCTKDLPMKHSNNYRISVNDDLCDASFKIMYESFTDVVDIIDINLKNNKTVIVHCFAGIQRSAAVICAYLMIHGYTLEDAILFMRQKKPDVFIGSINFIDSLQKLQLDLLNKKLGVNIENDNDIEPYCNDDDFYASF
jgi:protein-tyrosine phosphatase